MLIPQQEQEDIRQEGRQEQKDIIQEAQQVSSKTVPQTKQELNEREIEYLQLNSDILKAAGINFVKDVRTGWFKGAWQNLGLR